ncbi:hypothetical protein [Campylobacter troglodytis]|uniref:hypothetical protein n=1 Tax=Campylobacter troglodytis TaxID=654363 RepID=UPI001157208D|nr:hypothetical protein [Campylobacter troglodytis]
MQGLTSARFTGKLQSLRCLGGFFTSFCLATLQEEAKAHYKVKHAKFEFANGLNHINEIVNFFASCYTSCKCKQKRLCKVSSS